MPRAKAFGHLHRTAAGVIIPVERRPPWSFGSVTTPSACPAYQGGETRWPVSKRRGSKRRLEIIEAREGHLSCLNVYPLLSQANVPYQDEQASPKGQHHGQPGGGEGIREWPMDE